MQNDANFLIEKRVKPFSFRLGLAKIFSSVGALNASMVINRSSVALLIYAKFFSYHKIIFFKQEELPSGANSTETIKNFLTNISHSKVGILMPALQLRLGIEGSGILTKALQVTLNDKEEVKVAILKEIKKNMPMADASTLVRFKINKTEGNVVDVTAVLLKKDFLMSLQKLFGQFQLNLASVRVSSLNLIDIIPAKSYGFLAENSNYSFAALVLNNSLKHFIVNHDKNSAKAFERLQQQWESSIGKTISTQLPIYVAKEDAHLPVQINAFNRIDATGFLKKIQKNLLATNYFTSGELYKLQSKKSFSPEILDEISINKLRKKNLIYQLLFYFLLFQCFTPLIYQKLQQQRQYLLRETRYSIVNTDIKEKKENFNHLQKNQEELVELLKFVRRANANNSDFLQKISLASIKDLVVNRIDKTRTHALISGYALNIQVLSTFIEELERQFTSANFELKKTTKKGEAIAFSIQWKVNRRS